METRGVGRVFASAGLVLLTVVSFPGRSLAREELVLAAGKEPEAGFDPTTGWGRYGTPLFQSTLLSRDNDLRIVNDLAVERTISEDGLTWTVRIRPEVKFSDGTALTAKDVAYTYETAKKSGSVVDLSTLKSAVAIDRTTVQFQLVRPHSTFVNVLATLGIVPQATHGKDYGTRPIGSGPYRLVQYDRGQKLVVEVNSLYYGPKPAFKKLTFLFMSEDAAFMAAKAGKLDVVAVPASLADQKVKGMKLRPVQSVDNRGIMFPTRPAGSKTSEGEPIGDDVTSDPAIRKAINLLVNRKSLVQGVLLGHGAPAYTICDRLPWWNPAVTFLDADLEGARKLLAAAGWKAGGGSGVLVKEGRRAAFRLLYPADDQIRQSLALAVADQVRPLGIAIEVVGKSWDDIKKRMHADAVLFGWGSHDPEELYNVYSSRQQGKGFWNPGFYANSTVDGYLDRALATLDHAKQMKLWQLAQWDGQTGFAGRDGDAPWVWLVNLDHCYFVAEGLNTGKQRIEPHGHGWPITANIAEWRWTGQP